MNRLAHVDTEGKADLMSGAFRRARKGVSTEPALDQANAVGIAAVSLPVGVRPANAKFRSDPGIFGTQDTFGQENER